MASLHVKTVRRILDEELAAAKDARPLHRLQVWVVPRSKKRCNETCIETYEAARVMSAHKRGDLYRFQLLPSYAVVSVRVAAIAEMDDCEVIM